MQKSAKLLNSKIINDSIQCIVNTEMICKGGQATIYRGRCKDTDQEIIIKHSKYDLSQEYLLLNKLAHIPGIPKTYGLKQDQNYSTIYIECLSQDLHQLLESLKKCSLKTVCMIAIKILEILKQVHSLGIVHRDIKPSNMMIKANDDEQIFLIDYGIATEPNQDFHQNEIQGSLLFDSLQTHKRLPHRYIDDIEMLSYSLLLLYEGTLPWMKYANKIDADNSIYKRKKEFLCSKKMTLLPFHEMFGYIKFNSNKNMPNHDFLISIFSKILDKNKLEKNYIYDWNYQGLSTSLSPYKDQVGYHSYQNNKLHDSYTDLNEEDVNEGTVSFLNQQIYKFFLY